jgi:hypothetical protein
MHSAAYGPRRVLPGVTRLALKANSFLLNTKNHIFLNTFSETCLDALSAVSSSASSH